MGDTNIEWADKVWNPTIGCSPVNRGCEKCYAIGQAHRWSTYGRTPQYHGVTVKKSNGVRWTGVVRLDESKLALPLKWTKPSRIFVNSMSDLFHESLTTSNIAIIMHVGIVAPQHTYLCLTKRYNRLRDFDLSWMHRWWQGASAATHDEAVEAAKAVLACKTVVPWLSLEPLVEPVRVRKLPKGLKWIVVGGESGPNSRPCQPEWIWDVVDDCKDGGIPVFVKQFGSAFAKDARLRHSKGGDPAEFQPGVMPREWPEVAT